MGIVIVYTAIVKNCILTRVMVRVFYFPVKVKYKSTSYNGLIRKGFHPLNGVKVNKKLESQQTQKSVNPAGRQPRFQSNPEKWGSC